MSKAPPSFNGTENLIQNYCVTFSHNFGHGKEGTRPFKNSFVIKGADVTKENAVKIAEILFPTFTDIFIESIENDKNTLTPSEYDFIQGILKDKLRAEVAITDSTREKGGEVGLYVDYNTYLLSLINKMQARMDQFPVYHT
jgi:hypothetical protein